MIGAVFFDLDNTLVHRNNSIDKYAKIFFDSYKATLKTDITLKDIQTAIKRLDNGGYLASDSEFNSIKDKVSNGLLTLFSKNTPINAGVLREHWITHFHNCALPMDGANELINALAQLGYSINIVSNGAHDTRLKTAQQLKSFPKINQLLSSGSIGVKKPHPEIFSAALASVNLKAEDCWFVGDHPINDIKGAQQAGLKAIWLQGFHEWPEQQKPADFTVRSLDEVLQKITLKEEGF